MHLSSPSEAARTSRDALLQSIFARSCGNCQYPQRQQERQRQLMTSSMQHQQFNSPTLQSALSPARHWNSTIGRSLLSMDNSALAGTLFIPPTRPEGLLTVTPAVISHLLQQHQGIPGSSTVAFQQRLHAMNDNRNSSHLAASFDSAGVYPWSNGNRNSCQLSLFPPPPRQQERQHHNASDLTRTSWLIGSISCSKVQGQFLPSPVDTFTDNFPARDEMNATSSVSLPLAERNVDNEKEIKEEKEDGRSDCLISTITTPGAITKKKSGKDCSVQASGESSCSAVVSESKRKKTSTSRVATSSAILSGKTFPSERSQLNLNLDENCSCTLSEQTQRILKKLGATLRSKTDPFIDVTALPIPQGPIAKRFVRGSDRFFPEQLHNMLMEVEREGLYEDAVSFLPHGRAFRVHKRDVFLEHVLPQYFGCEGNNKKWTSFLRQLQLYGFLRVSEGRDCGAYYHELFVRTRPEHIAKGEDPDFDCLPPIS